MTTRPFYSPDEQPVELTGRVVIIAIVLAALLAMSNAYLALKIGILTSASIPAAVLSMGVLRFFRNSNILENNLIQTAASAGEAVAGGVVFCVPALVIIGYWTHFAYWPTALIALLAGLLGILFSIPLRHTLMTQPYLNYPEGRAIAEVLKASVAQTIGLRFMLQGTLLGALLSFASSGLKLVATQAQYWINLRGTLFGVGMGFSPTLIGAGYLVGFDVGLGLFVGAVINWLVGVPFWSHRHPVVGAHKVAAAQAVAHLWSEHLRYIGLGAMLLAGCVALFNVLVPLMRARQAKVLAANDPNCEKKGRVRTEQDLPRPLFWIGTIGVFIGLYALFYSLFDLDVLGFAAHRTTFLLMALFYILVVGFFLVTLCSYFSGLVGVSATPGSAILIAGILLVGLILRYVMTFYHVPETQVVSLAAAAIIIMIGSVITGAGGIANDNIQDLKVGHILGATPWKQQVMLMLGVVVASLVIPPVMEVLYQVYGIGGMYPRAGMDPHQVLAAPPAAMMAALTQAILTNHLPLKFLGFGAAILFVLLLFNRYCLRYWGKQLSVLSVGLGMYLPLSASIPLFVGGLFARVLRKRPAPQQQRSVLLACGLVAGAALMDVGLAVPFALARNADVLRVLPHEWEPISVVLAAMSLLLIFRFLKKASSA